MTLSSLAQISDQDLLTRVTQLAAEEREATALLIAHLAELDARRLFLAEGYSSLFTYCTEALHLSEHAAYSRIEAARAARKFPALLEMLGEGSLTLTTVGLLGPHLTAENHQDLLDKARFKSKRAVEELIAGLCPQPPVPAIVRRLPAARPRLEHQAVDGAQPVLNTQETAEAATAVALAARPARERATITPLAPERYKEQFTARAETYEKLRQAQALLRHQVPDGDLDEIVDRALTALIEKLAREKLAATERPRRGRPTAPGTRHIPAEVKRAVWLRDGGRCAFVGAKGRRCNEIGFLEFHHAKPYAVGGASTIDNLQLRCRAHNGYEADLYFGPRDAAEVREPDACYSVRTEFGPSAFQSPPSYRVNHSGETWIAVTSPLAQGSPPAVTEALISALRPARSVIRACTRSGRSSGAGR